jgi:hypothetical protein
VLIVIMAIRAKVTQRSEEGWQVNGCSKCL